MLQLWQFQHPEFLKCLGPFPSSFSTSFPLFQDTEIRIGYKERRWRLKKISKYRNFWKWKQNDFIFCLLLWDLLFIFGKNWTSAYSMANTFFLFPHSWNEYPCVRSNDGVLWKACARRGWKILQRKALVILGNKELPCWWWIKPRQADSGGWMGEMSCDEHGRWGCGDGAGLEGLRGEGLTETSPGLAGGCGWSVGKQGVNPLFLLPTHGFCKAPALASRGDFMCHHRVQVAL